LNLSYADIQKLIDALQFEGGDMERTASVIETLARENGKDSTMTPFACLYGNVMMPGNRTEVRTQSAGNGVLSGTGT
jgi:hypothetical protein